MPHSLPSTANKEGVFEPEKCSQYTIYTHIMIPIIHGQNLWLQQVKHRHLKIAKWKHTDNILPLKYIQEPASAFLLPAAGFHVSLIVL